MARRRWSHLSERSRGREEASAVVLVLVNSLGALPLGYFRFGRRPSPPAHL